MSNDQDKKPPAPMIFRPLKQNGGNGNGGKPPSDFENEQARLEEAYNIFVDAAKNSGPIMAGGIQDGYIPSKDRENSIKARVSKTAVHVYHETGIDTSDSEKLQKLNKLLTKTTVSKNKPT